MVLKCVFFAPDGSILGRQGGFLLVVWFVIDARPEAVRPEKALPVRPASLGGNESNDGTVFQLGGTGQTCSWGSDDAGFGRATSKADAHPWSGGMPVTAPTRHFLRRSPGSAGLGFGLGSPRPARWCQADGQIRRFDCRSGEVIITAVAASCDGVVASLGSSGDFETSIVLAPIRRYYPSGWLGLHETGARKCYVRCFC